MFYPTTTKNSEKQVSSPLAPIQHISVNETLNSLPIGVIILNRQGQIVDSNLKAAKLLGLGPEKLVGIHLSQFWPKTAAEISLAFSGGRQAIGLVPAEMNDCYIQVKPLSGVDSGATVSIFERFDDLPNALNWHASDPLTPYYKQIFDSSSDGVVIIDNKGRIILMNAAAERQLGLNIEKVQGMSVSYLVENNYTSDIISFDVLATGKPITKLVQYFKTGKHILLTGTPIFNSSGEVYLVIVNERDLTELLELQTSLQQQKLLVSHFKNELYDLKMAELTAREVVAKSPTMMRRMETAAKLARYDTHQILLTGESGVGKSLLAKFIHSKSKRALEPFIPINCSALPEQLLEAELFGYEKGAFPGAGPEGRAGHLEVASKGTLYLDEVGEMSLAMQTKLLTFLDTRSFRRINGHQIQCSDCAIISASNQNLRELTEKKLFRSELFFRLNVFSIDIPPLRDRKDDIIELARREIIHLNQRYSLKKELDPLSLEILLNYNFPGNVRELINCLHQAVLLSDKPQLGDCLALLLDQSEKSNGLNSKGPNSSHVQLYDNIAETEKHSLTVALDTCKNTREMAAFLGISQAGVSRKLRKYGLPLPKNFSKT